MYNATEPFVSQPRLLVFILEYHLAAAHSVHHHKPVRRAVKSPRSLRHNRKKFVNESGELPVSLSPDIDMRSRVSYHNYRLRQKPKQVFHYRGFVGTHLS